MAEHREDPREHPVDAEGQSESGANPEDAGSRESASDRQAIAEQRALVTADFASARPPQREELVRVLSRVCEDPIEVNAVIEEIQGLSGEPLRVYIKSLERVLAARLELQGERLEAQGAKLDTQHEDLRAQGARLDAQGERLDAQGAKLEKHSEAISSLRAEIRIQSMKIDAQSEKIDAQDSKIDALSEKVEKHGEAIGSLRAEIRIQGTKIDAQGVKLDAHAKETRAEIRALDVKLVEQIGSLHREFRLVLRLMLAVFMLLATLGFFSLFMQSCSRRGESNVGTEASQTVAEPHTEMPSSSAASPEPSAEAPETGETVKADGEEPASTPDATR